MDTSKEKKRFRSPQRPKVNPLLKVTEPWICSRRKTAPPSRQLSLNLWIEKFDIIKALNYTNVTIEEINDYKARGNNTTV